MRVIITVILSILSLLLFAQQQTVVLAKTGGTVRPVYVGDGIDYAIPDSILNATLVNGTVIETRGFYTPGDGGQATYMVQADIPTGLQNDTSTVIPLSGGNYAVLMNYRNCNVLQLGMKNDSTAIDAHILARAKRVLELDSSSIHFPMGKYLFSKSAGSNYAVLLSGVKNARITGQDAVICHSTLNTDPNYLSAFELDNCRNVTFEGLAFVGSVDVDTSKTLSTIYSITCDQPDTNIIVRNCKFYSTSPVEFIGNRGHIDFEFTGNLVQNNPNALIPCTNSKINNNTFRCLTYNSGRSHAIYAYGYFRNIQVTNNYFTNTGGNALKFRAENGTNNIKYGAIFSNNTCENMPDQGGCVDLGTPNSDIAILSYVVSSNTFINCALAVQTYNPQGYTISKNTIVQTLESTLIGTVGMNLSGTTYRDTRNEAGILLGNSFFDERNILTEFTLNTLPVENDTLQVGARKYTFKASPTASTDIQIQGTLQSQVETIADKLKEPVGSGGLVGLYCVWASDVGGDISTYNIIINVFTTAAITTNLDITTTRNAVDYRTATSGIICTNIPNPINISNNTFSSLSQAISISDSFRPKVHNNIFDGMSSTVNINFTGNAYLEFYNNTADDRWGNASAYRVDFNACWMPIIHNNVGFPFFSFVSNYYDIFSANYAVKSAGDGKAENLFWFGRENSTGDTTTFSILYWEDGDQVILDSAGTTLFTFTYQEVGSLGANEFNDEPSLIALIDATYAFTATEKNVNDNNATILVRAQNAGTAGNDYGITTVSNCRLCGLTLQSDFVGGSASADRTVFWTPLANAYSIPNYGFGNSATSALTGIYIDQAATVNGAFYMLRHSAAGGTEQFYFSTN